MRITRSWRPQRLGSVVFTGNGNRRGSIDCTGIDATTACAIWRINPADGTESTRLTGNYLDAERALLAATAEMDAIDEVSASALSRAIVTTLNEPYEEANRRAWANITRPVEP